jgi:hypothetical protein
MKQNVRILRRVDYRHIQLRYCFRLCLRNIRYWQIIHQDNLGLAGQYLFWDFALLFVAVVAQHRRYPNKANIPAVAPVAVFPSE